jgi:hypothetical protein
MPRLRAFAASSAVGELSVKSVGVATRCGDGMLELSAGTRVRAGGKDCTVDAARLAVARGRNRHGSYAAHVGALGQALHAAGLRTAAVGADAAALLADETGRVDDVASTIAGAAQTADVVAVVDDGLYVTRPRRAAAAAVDTRFATQLTEIPPGATVLVVGVSDGRRGPPHLHVLVVAGPSWPHRALRSETTDRTPFVQLVDIAPTVLAAEGVAVPSTMIGRPAHVTSDAAGSVRAYADDDRHARAASDVSGRTRNVLAVLALVALVGWLVRVPGTRGFARLLLVAPVLTYLVQVLPWWRWGGAAYAGLIGASALLAAVVITALGRRWPLSVVLAGPLFTATVLVADQLAGAPLQLSAPMGDNPLVAGRFHGMGNLDFALACSSLLFCGGVLAARPGTRNRSVLVAAGFAAVALVVDGAPMLGDDFGGVLALVPASLALVALVAGLRLTWRRVATALLVAVVVGIAVALADYAQPADQQTHIGTFVGHVLHGGSDPVLTRKWHAALRSLGNIAPDLLVAGSVAALVAGRAVAGRLLSAVPGLGPAIFAAGVLAVLGSVLNDSGIVVAAAVALVVVPAVVSSGAGSAIGDNRRKGLRPSAHPLEGS